MAHDATATIVVYYEHPQWFERLFAELDPRGLPYRKLPATEHVLDPAAPVDPNALVFNRMSASAATRDHADALAYTLDLLTGYELQGVPVINGARAYAYEISKAKQLALIGSLGLRFPKTRIIHRADQAAAAARDLRFPIVFKPNIGGRGAGVVRFDDPAVLAEVAAAGGLDLGFDSVALLQEYVPKRDGKITRVEVLDGRCLYAIDVTTSAETFDLCPADICRVPAPVALGETCAAEPAPTVTAVRAHPPEDAIADAERIVNAAGIDVGGVEFMVDDRDGARLFYDINALSNFVANPLETLGFDPWQSLGAYLETRARGGVALGGTVMRFGYWMPVFGGWLRNVEDENMAASWEYVSALARRSERIGYDLSLVAELNLNDIKGVEAPSLDAWSTAAALTAVTERLELMVAVRPTFHLPALLAKQAATIDRIGGGGRLSLNVVSSWWKTEAEMYGVGFEQHDDRYARTAEWLDVLDGVWSQPRFTYQGTFYSVTETALEPKPATRPRPVIYAGGESEAAKELIAAKCDAYVMHGDPPERVGEKIADMRARRERMGLGPMQYGVAGYTIVRDAHEDAQRELARITDVRASAAGFANFQQWLSGTQLDTTLAQQEYSVSNRGLRSGLVGTPDAVGERVAAFEAAGVDLLLLQCSPQAEEMERFAQAVIAPLRKPAAAR